MPKFRIWCTIELSIPVPVEIDLDKSPENLTSKELAKLLTAAKFEAEENFLDNIDMAEIDAEIEGWEQVADEE